MDSQAEDYTESMYNHKEVFYRYPLRLVHGIPLMEPIAQQWDPIENFQARPDDLLISTYPKAGTTWMQEIVDLILARGDVEKARRAPTYIRIPFLEICSPPPVPSGVSYLVNAPSPRVIKTHLPFQLVPKSFWENNCKVIYVARNAKDNVVSYFFFDQMNVTQPEPGPWEGYIKKFMEGKVAWGSWYDHVRRYWDEKEKHKILYVFYEDMKEDLAQEVRRVMNFLEVDLPEEIVQKIVHHTSFQVMKDNPMANYSSVPDCIFDKAKGKFMRKGEYYCYSQSMISSSGNSSIYTKIGWRGEKWEPKCNLAPYLFYITK
uniref:Sulfotransferase n=1 Tax=Anolis carolinensis TaxID=28377 RepID=H9GTY2_ANOCA